MSMGDADAKFPGQHTGIPPSPTRENPGQVYPKSDPNPAPRLPQSGDDNHVQTVIGNPFLLQSALKQVDGGLTNVITILEEEETSQGSSDKSHALVQKLRGWRNDLNEMMYNTSQPCPEPDTTDGRTGGLFTD